MTVNENLIRVVVQQIEQDLARWHQHWWAGMSDEAASAAGLEDYHREDADYNDYKILDPQQALTLCGTSFCFAGHAVIAAGETILFDADSDGTIYGEAEWCLTKQGNVEQIEERAQELLGLNATQAMRLFNGAAGSWDFKLYKKTITTETGVSFE